MELLSAFSDEEFNAFNRMFINPSSFCHFPGAENGGLSHRIVDWSSPTFPTTAMGYSSVNVVQDSSENVKKRPLVLKDAQRVHKRAQNSKNNRKISLTEWWREQH
ncbi:hypothetical protein F3Y22_tig00110458pilonHSYRG00039 [Hibiscus syriacus]|uniref:Uncharacterized protein n=1 Tax=Hibiscus syriacus TaxID=106335 RepID=A0A6A3AHT3_HIBSY|nr:hypothetical protein F3Y22_tig00110458pilonHSYRG00039 [Hibiscus syriacus]